MEVGAASTGQPKAGLSWESGSPQFFGGFGPARENAGTLFCMVSRINTKPRWYPLSALELLELPSPEPLLPRDYLGSHPKAFSCWAVGKHLKRVTLNKTRTQTGVFCLEGTIWMLLWGGGRCSHQPLLEFRPQGSPREL